MDIKEDTSDNDSTNHQVVQVIEDKMVPKNLFVTVLTVVTLIATVADARAPQRISGGDETSLTKIPYHASILLQTEFLCGGVIISNQHILTTANCLVSVKDVEQLNVFVGTDFIDIGDQHSVGSVVNYPGYDFTDGYSPDIAIIVLNEIIKFDENIKSIPFLSEPLIEYLPVNISDWKNISLDDVVVEQLRQTEVIVVTGEKCRKLIEGDNIVWNNQMCGYSFDGKIAYYGQEGCPVTHNGQLVAIIARRKADSYYRRYDYYTNVYQYEKWINEVIGTVRSISSD